MKHISLFKNFEKGIMCYYNFILYISLSIKGTSCTSFLLGLSNSFPQNMFYPMSIDVIYTFTGSILSQATSESQGKYSEMHWKDGLKDRGS